VSSYDEFLANRAQLADAGGFEPIGLPGHLFDYQTNLVEWAVRKGRGGIFADCGLGTRPGERVLTPFMGVGSEVYAAVQMGRFGIGAELKPSYFQQALRNLAAVDDELPVVEAALFDDAFA